MTRRGQTSQPPRHLNVIEAKGRRRRRGDVTLGAAWNMITGARAWREGPGQRGRESWSTSHGPSRASERATDFSPTRAAGRPAGRRREGRPFPARSSCVLDRRLRPASAADTGNCTEISRRNGPMLSGPIPPTILRTAQISHDFIARLSGVGHNGATCAASRASDRLVTAPGRRREGCAGLAADGAASRQGQISEIAGPREESASPTWRRSSSSPSAPRPRGVQGLTTRRPGQ